MGTKTVNEFILTFRIQKLTVGVSLQIVDRVIRAVELLPLPGAPAIVMGIINMGGDAIPIVDFRKRFSIKTRDPIPSDSIVIVRSRGSRFGFLVDEVEGLKNIKEQQIKSSGELLPGSDRYIEGIAIIEKTLVMIHDVDKFLSLKEEKQLSNALRKNSNGE